MKFKSTGVMDLRTWLFHNRMKVTEFARLIGIHRSYVHMWMSGTKKPHAKLMDEIRELTMGKVDSFDALLDKKGTQDGQEEA